MHNRAAPAVPCPTGFRDMNLRSDLSRLIQGQLDEHGISWPRSMPLDRLVARCFEMNIRQIHPASRQVHFSDRATASLGELARQGKDDKSARDAWTGVFRLRQLHVEGANVNAFLSKSIRDLQGWDGLLWQYGMHHFHLGHDQDKDGFVERSGQLLFAIVGPKDVYFVDVRPHPPRRGVEWVSQELLRIVHSNWPHLIEANVLKGVCGNELTDTEMHELRRKNVNYAVNIEGQAVAPMLGGMATDGSSVHCTFLADKLLCDLKHHEEVLQTDAVRDALVRNMQTRGSCTGPVLDFELVSLESLEPTPEMVAALTAEECISRDLCRLGLAIVQKETRSPIVIHDTGLAKSQ